MDPVWRPNWIIPARHFATIRTVFLNETDPARLKVEQLPSLLLNSRNSHK